MPDPTPNLAMPYIMAAQAQKHVTHNEALNALDALTQIAVVSRTLTTPPVSPVAGERHIVSTGATDEWEGQDGQLAAYQDDSWAFYAPKSGWTAWVEAESQLLIFDGTHWQWPGLATPFGAFTRLQTFEEELSVSGATTTANIEIPNRAIVLGVSVTVAESITGATAFNVGTAGEANKFGGSLGINIGDTNIGVIGPTAFYANTPIILTPIGSDFASGTVRLALHIIECGPALV
ncbi:MAG: DUF2793 domain-containing protein [Rhizobiaceae bacterium]